MHILARHFGPTDNPLVNEQIEMLSLETLQAIHKDIAGQLAIAVTKDFYEWHGAYHFGGHYTLNVVVCHDNVRSDASSPVPYVGFNVTGPCLRDPEYFLLFNEEKSRTLSPAEALQLLQNPR